MFMLETNSRNSTKRWGKWVSFYLYEWINQNVKIRQKNQKIFLVFLYFDTASKDTLSEYEILKHFLISITGMISNIQLSWIIMIILISKEKINQRVIAIYMQVWTFMISPNLKKRYSRIQQWYYWIFSNNENEHKTLHHILDDNDDDDDNLINTCNTSQWVKFCMMRIIIAY